MGDADSVRQALGKVADEGQKQDGQQTDGERHPVETAGPYVVRTTANRYESQKYHQHTCIDQQKQQQPNDTEDDLHTGSVKSVI